MGVEGESQVDWSGGSRILPPDPGSLEGHLNQPPTPGQLPLRKAPAAAASNLQGRWHRDPVLLGVIQPGCSLRQVRWGGGRGRPSWSRHCKLKGKRDQGARAWGPHCLERTLCPPLAPAGRRTITEARTELEEGGWGVPTGTPATASHPTESA